MRRILIAHARIVNEGQQFAGSVVVENDRIARIIEGPDIPYETFGQVVDAEGCYLIPGVIDEHVHFRDPGLTRKADITSESMAAAAGGVTSVMDMPNTVPQTVTLEALEEKQRLYDEKCLVNHACYFGATNDNQPLFSKLNRHEVCGIKLFMGSSTGNMLVDKMDSLRRIFDGTDMLIMTHCEDSGIISRNAKSIQQTYQGEEVPIRLHPQIRSAEACYQSSALAAQLARESGARLHIAHISTAEEIRLLDRGPLAEKKITGEACIAHLMFCDADYDTLGARIKCNPAVKSLDDRNAIRQAVHGGIIDTIATDHAPHLLSDKEGGALKAASGMPMIQFSLPCMLELVDNEVLSIEEVVEKMCHNPAILFHIKDRGYIRTGYKADLTIVKPQATWTVCKDLILSKCQWSPLEGHTFNWKVVSTFVNGRQIYADGRIDDSCMGERIYFN